MTMQQIIRIALTVALTARVASAQETVSERRQDNLSPPDLRGAHPAALAELADVLDQLADVRRRVRDGAGDSLPQGRGAGGRTGGPETAGTFDPAAYDPMAGPVVTGAPFSADATTTVTQTLGDGTRIEQRATAKFHRDTSGRVRREQTIMGLDGLNPSGQQQTIVTFDSTPGDPMPYVLDPAARTARRTRRGSATGMTWNVSLSLRIGGTTDFSQLSGRALTLDTPVTFQGLVISRRGVPPDLRPVEEQLGTRLIEGVKATGVRTTVTIPANRVGNDRPIQITDERWESSELRVVLHSRYSDPRTGIVEYELTNVIRAEQADGLFTVPPDYTVNDGAPNLRIGGPGGRQGGGGRGVR